MRDLEDRLAAALADGAERAPGAAGLASGARQRAQVRRRRRVVAGAVAAVVAVAVPVALLGGVGGSSEAPVAPAPTSVASDLVGWRTVTLSGVEVDVPEAWVELGSSACADGPPCGRRERVEVANEAAYDYVIGLAEGGGSVLVGDRLVSVSDSDDDTARRVLASARPPGSEVPDLAAWASTYVGPSTVAVPDGVEAERLGGLPCSPSSSAQLADGRWQGCRDSVRVTAPTQALADVVLSTVFAGAWVTVEVEDVALDLPPGWRVGECDEGAVVYLPPNSDRCDLGSTRVILRPTMLANFAKPSLRSDSGAVYSGSQVVSVDSVPFELARRILASARPVSEPVPDVDTWRTIDAGNGVTATVPEDPDVEVRVRDGIPRCASVPPAARPVEGRWEVALCRNRIVTVIAPTQALAEVVAAQVEGW